MKVVFICGALEPGRDGVGDYTRRLAVALGAAGHEVSVIAINDKFIQQVSEGVQYSDGRSVDVLRVPSSCSDAERYKLAKEFITKHDPEFLSLQYVGFSYHPKGLPYNLAGQLSSLGKGKRWHIMFHELWVGAGVTSPKLHLIWGFFQQMVIRILVKVLKPAVVHTQSQLYRAMLLNIGVNSRQLALFGNIPVISEASDLEITPSKELTFVVFGTIHPDIPVNDFVKELAGYKQKNGLKPVKLILLGRCGSLQESWEEIWKREDFLVENLGEQDTVYISDVLSRADYGISTSTFFMIEKSGTVAAMREHGLPVICIGKPWTPRTSIDFNSPDGIIEYRKGNIDDCLSKTPVKQDLLGVNEIARRFSGDVLGLY